MAARDTDATGRGRPRLGGSIGTVDRGLDRRGLGIWAESNGQLGHIIVDVATVLLEYRLKASLIRRMALPWAPSSIIKIGALSLSSTADSFLYPTLEVTSIGILPRSTF